MLTWHQSNVIDCLREKNPQVRPNMLVDWLMAIKPSYGATTKFRWFGEALSAVLSHISLQLSVSRQLNELPVKCVFCSEWCSPSHASMLCFATQEQTAQTFQNRVIVIARQHGKPERQIRSQLLKNLSPSSALMVFFFPHKLNYKLTEQESKSSWQPG